jgi:hypothetical protein
MSVIENDLRSRHNESHQDDEAHRKQVEDQRREALQKEEEDRMIEERCKRNVDTRANVGDLNNDQIAEELSKDLKKVTPPTFDGKTIGDNAEAWIISMEKYFHVRNLSGQSRALWGAFQLIGEAATWWNNEMAEKKLRPGQISWDDFLVRFRK